MLCIFSHLFFKRSLLGFLVIINVFQPSFASENLVFQNDICYFIPHSRFTTSLLTVIAISIAKVL